MEKLVKPSEDFKVKRAFDMKNRVYVLINHTVSATRKGVYFPPTFQIPAEDQVYMSWTDKDGNEHDGEMRHIRYVPAYNTIFVDEQPKDDKRMVRGEIWLRDGVLIAHPRETNLIKYMDICNWNEKNEETRMPGKSSFFKLNDSEATAKKHNDSEKEKFKVKKMIYEMAANELKGLAQTLYVREYRTKSSEELQAELIVLAERDPNAFLAEVNNEARKMKYFVMQAEEKQHIYYEASTNSLKWRKGGLLLVSAPLGQDCFDYFIDLALTNDRYKTLYENLKDAVTTKIAETKQQLVQTNTLLKGDEKTIEEMLDIAAKKGLIEVSPAWIKFPSIEKGNFGPGKNKGVELIKENPEALEFLRAASADVN